MPILHLQKLTALSARKLYLSIAIGVAILLLLAGSLFWKKHSISSDLSDNIVTVRTVLIAPERSNTGYTYSGNVRGRYESQLAFQVSGKIVKRNIQLGSAVQAGAILMQIEPKDLQQVVNTAISQVSSAESQFRLAESNLNRYRQLFAQNAISRAQLDQYETAYEVAQATVRQLSAQQTQSSNQLEYSLLTADKPGIISAISAEAGQVVAAGQSVLTIVHDGDREVEINVPENRIEELRHPVKLKVTFWAIPNLAIDGSVREIAPMADAVSRTFSVRIQLINPPPDIQLGMTAAVSVANSIPQPMLQIPLTAIYQTGNKPAVWVLNGDTLTLRFIETGEFGNGYIQVLSGLQPGDHIVIAGVHKLKEGQKVKVSGDSL